MNPIKVDFTSGGSGKGKGSGQDAYLVPGKAGLKTVISIIGTVIGACITYYFLLPPLNPKSMLFYLFLGIIALIFAAFQVVLSGILRKPEYKSYVKKRVFIPGIIIVALLLIVGIGYLISSVVFRAGSYSQIIDVKEIAQFEENDVIQEVNFNNRADRDKVPVLDDAAAEALARRTLGVLGERGLESQFELTGKFTQINYNNNPYRVTTLSYGDIFKWFKNTNAGIPGYVMVNMVTREAEFKLLPEGKYIRYSTEEHFNHHLLRHLRFEHPTYIYGDPHFEVDEAGNPQWVCPVLDKTIGIFGGRDVKSVILVDPVTGACREYSLKEIQKDPDLQWIDSVYSSELLVEQYNYKGKYSGGFINSLLGQKGVRVVTEGYNYLAIDDDVYLYTGVTSVSEDQAIIGFLLVNMRTKDARFIKVNGAKETSAASSAEGKVQNYGYKATFPILLNIQGEPTYFMSLKDSSDTVKGYAMVNVKNYQIVATRIGYSSADIAECSKDYANQIKAERSNTGEDVTPPDDTPTDQPTEPVTPTEPTTAAPAGDETTVSGVISDIRTPVMAGESVYFIQLEASDLYYTISAKDAPNVVILNVGDSVTITYIPLEGAAILAATAVEPA